MRRIALAFLFLVAHGNVVSYTPKNKKARFILKRVPFVTSEVEKSTVYRDLERVMDWKESEKKNETAQLQRR